MKKGNPIRPTLEMLEDRLTPSLTIMTDAAGNLTISGKPDFAAGTASQPITITETAPSTYTITEGITPLGTVFAPGNVSVNFNQSSLDDAIQFDLMGNAIGGTLSVTDGAGNNAAFFLSAGSIGGNATFNNVNNLDTTAGVNIGGNLSFLEPSKNLQTFISLGAPVSESIGGNVQINTGNGTAIVNIAAGGNVSIGGSLTAQMGNGNHLFTFTKGSTIGSNFTYIGGSGQDSVTLNGTVSGNVYANMGNGPNTFTLENPTGEIDGNLAVIGGNGNDVVTVAGQVGGGVTASLGAGSNQMIIPAGATILGNYVNYYGGARANDFEFNGTAVGAAFYVYLGIGPVNNFTLGATGNARSIFINFGVSNAAHTKSITFGPGISFPLTYINF
jgi:hypothetical protein